MERSFRPEARLSKKSNTLKSCIARMKKQSSRPKSGNLLMKNGFSLTCDSRTMSEVQEQRDDNSWCAPTLERRGRVRFDPMPEIRFIVDDYSNMSWWTSEELISIRSRDRRMSDVDPQAQHYLFQSMKLYRQICGLKTSEYANEPSKLGGFGDAKLQQALALDLDQGYRGMDTWCRITGRTKDYVRSMVELSRMLRQFDETSEILRANSMQITQPSRRWARTLGVVDSMAAATPVRNERESLQRAPWW